MEQLCIRILARLSETALDFSFQGWLFRPIGDSGGYGGLVVDNVVCTVELENKVQSYMFFSAYLLSNLKFWRVRAGSLALDRCSVPRRDVWQFWHNFDICKPPVKDRQEQDSKLG
jgi:hypothetical protein